MTFKYQKAFFSDALGVMTLLAEKYPKTFFVFEQRRIPLKIGIHRDIIADLGIDEKLLSTALFAYTINQAYLLKLKEGAIRVDLSGNEAGLVTADQALTARSARQGIVKKRLKESREPKQAEPVKPAKPVKPAAKKQTKPAKKQPAKSFVVEKRAVEKPAVDEKKETHPARGDGLSSLRAAWQARTSGGGA